jgi:hypothetical protein
VHIIASLLPWLRFSVVESQRATLLAPFFFLVDFFFFFFFFFTRIYFVLFWRLTNATTIAATMSSTTSKQQAYDYLIKLLLIGDSGVGKRYARKAERAPARHAAHRRLFFFNYYCLFLTLIIVFL